MTSYYDDDSAYPRQGRAQVPGGGGQGQSAGYEPEFDPFAPEQPDTGYGAPAASDPYASPYADPYADPYAAPPPAAPTGRASVGRASVRPAEFDEQYDDPYRRPSTGSPANSDGFDPFGDEPAGPRGSGLNGAGAAGRASVAGVAGRATVGRATIPGQVRPGEPIIPGGPAGPGGPGRPGGPAGPGGPGGPGGATKGKGPANKKARRRNRILAGAAALIMITGLLVVVGTYYSASVPLPQDLPMPQATRLTYSNGHPMAQIGQITHFEVDNIPLRIEHAVVATEDETFYTNSGVDIKGIARAFVNNITGGSTQGASTITQQYARNVEKLTTGESYTRKIKEAVIAVKLTKSWSKEKILNAYLNTVYFGRGAYGIQAAAMAYFNKAKLDDLSDAQAFVLADVIKDPSGTSSGPAPYDPSCRDASGKVCESALSRWQYTRTQMAKLKFSFDASKPYPSDSAVAYKDVNTGANQNINTPLGFVVHQVINELITAKANGKPIMLPGTDTPAFTKDKLLEGGYLIKTTIDEGAQEAANKIFDIQHKGSPVYGYVPKHTAAAMVALNPQTGRVIAYYGGANGSGFDYAGIWQDPVMTDLSGLQGGHRDPGSSMKTMTMATALSQGYSINSMWDGPHFVDRPNGQEPLHNNGGDDCPVCTMWQGLKKSTNTMYYNIGQKVGVGNVIDMMQKMGVNNIWNDSTNKRYPLTPGNGKQIASEGKFGGELAFGQVGIDLQDLAHAVSTIANSGVVTTEHFVDDVTLPTSTTAVYSEKLTHKPVDGVTTAMMHDEMWSMQQVMANGDETKPGLVPGVNNQLADGRQAAAKTGTWEFSEKQPNDDSVAAFNGFTAPGDGQISASVWVGDVLDAGPKTPSLPLRQMIPGTNKEALNSAGKPRILGGARVAAPLWKAFMDIALKTSAPGFKPAPITQFPAHTGVGDKSGPASTPSTQPATTNPTTATTAPTTQLQQPGNLHGQADANGNVTLNWANNNPPGTTYVVFRNGSQVGTTQQTNFSEKLTPDGTTYRYAVVAKDGAGNSSAPATTQVTVGSPRDSTPPSAPTGLSGSRSGNTVTLNWGASTDNVGVTGYNIYQNGTKVWSTSGKTSISRNTPITNATYTVRAVDAAGNESPPSNGVQA